MKPWEFADSLKFLPQPRRIEWSERNSTRLSTYRHHAKTRVQDFENVVIQAKEAVANDGDDAH